MSASFLHRRLRWRRIWLVFVAMVLTHSYGLFAAVGVAMIFAGKGEDVGVGFLMALFFGVGYALCLMPVIRQLWSMRRPDTYPDIVTVSRYGPLHQMVSEIDREVGDEDEVISIGSTIITFIPVPIGVGELHCTQVLLTRSWLIHLRGEGGHRMSFMRFDSILAAFRPLSHSARESVDKVVLIDRHGIRLEIYGTNRGLARLLSYVLQTLDIKG